MSSFVAAGSPALSRRCCARVPRVLYAPTFIVVFAAWSRNTAYCAFVTSNASNQ